MKQINLVPAAVLQKATTKRTVPYLVLAGLVGIGCAGAAWAGLGIQLNLLKSQKDTLISAEVERQKIAAKDLADLQVDSDLVNRVNTLNTFAKNDINWQRAFVYVASLTPKDVVLSNLSYGTSQSGVVLKLTGDAPSNVSYATFAQYLTSLKGTTVTSFNVDGYTYNPQNGHVVFSFSLVVPVSQINFTQS